MRRPAEQHDAQFDYYAKRLATASSDGTVTVYDVVGSEHREAGVLNGCGRPAVGLNA